MSNALNIMKCIISLLLLSTILGWHRSPPSQGNSASLKASAEEIVDLMAAKNFAAVARRVSDEFTGALSAQSLSRMWGALTTQTGPFKRRKSTAVGKGPGGYDEVTLRCVFEKDEVTVKVLFAGDKKIVGLGFIPNSMVITPLAPNTSQEEKESAVKGLGGLVAKMLVDEYFSGVVSKFSPELKDKLSEDKLKEDWASMTQNEGAFKKQVSARYDKEKGLDIAIIRCEFARGFVHIHVAFDTEGKIASLKFLPEL